MPTPEEQKIIDDYLNNMSLTPESAEKSVIDTYLDQVDLSKEAAYSDPVASQFDTQSMMNPFAKRVAHHATGSGFGQHAAGLGAGLGSSIEQFRQMGDVPLADRLGLAYERFKSSYDLGRQDYWEEQDIAKSQLPATAEATAMVAGAAPLMLLGGGRTISNIATKYAKPKAFIDQFPVTARAMQAAGLQGLLGIAGSREDTLNEQAWDGLVASMIGGSLPVTGEVASKTKDLVVNLANAAKSGYTTLRSKMTGVPVSAMEQFTKLGRKGLRDWFTKYADMDDPKSVDLAVENMFKAARDEITNKKNKISEAYGAAIAEKFTNKELPTEIVTETLKKIRNRKASINPATDDGKEAIAELTKLEGIIKGKPTGQTTQGLYGPKGEVLLPPGEITAPPTYSDFYDMYKQAKDLTVKNYKYKGDALAKSVSDTTSRIMDDLVRGTGGIQAKIRGIAPELQKLDDELSKMYKISKKFNTRYLKEGVDQTRLIHDLAVGSSQAGKMARGVKKITDGKIDLQEEASKMSALQTLAPTSLEPKSFAMRNLASMPVNATLGTMGVLTGTQLGGPLWGSIAAGSSYLATTPASVLTGLSLGRGARAIARPFGPTIEAARRMSDNELYQAGIQRALTERLGEEVEKTEYGDMPETLRIRLGQ